MKQLTLSLALIVPLLAILAACSKPKAAQTSSEVATDSLTDTIVVNEAPKDTVPWLDTTPIRMNLEKNDRFYCIVEVDYPQGEDVFNEAVRHYVVSQLNANRPIIGENKYAYKSYAGNMNDGKQVVDYFCRKQPYPPARRFSLFSQGWCPLCVSRIRNRSLRNGLYLLHDSLR